jgi:aminoglycoside phosphotransferase (APT) family kinase protein
LQHLACLSGEQLSVLTDARARVRERLEAFGKGSDRWGLLHGDFLPENVLVAADGLRLIDFDDCGDGWYVFELATGLFPLVVETRTPCVAPTSRLPQRARARRAPARFPIMARTLSYLGWPVGRPDP